MNEKFTPVNLEAKFNDDRSQDGWHPAIGGRLSTLPSGKQIFRGIPFELGLQDGKRWLVMEDQTAPATIAISGKASYILMAHFCDITLKNNQNPQSPDNEIGFDTHLGVVVANYTLGYQDGSDYETPIRRRFEIGQGLRVWGQEAFAALPHEGFQPIPGNEPFPKGKWGFYQTGFTSNQLPTSLQYWIFALRNPFPDKELSALKISPTGVCRIAVVGITLYHGKDHPLRYQRLKTLNVTLPEPVAIDDVRISIDLGVIARRYHSFPFDPQKWLQAPSAGLGEEMVPERLHYSLFLDVSANSDATLSIENHAIDLGEVFANTRGASQNGKVTIEILNPQKTWIYGKVIDETTSQPTPVRVSFRTADGRYFPPYGHRQEVNPHWFEDYGGDLLLGSTPYAYIDGKFQIELPIGEVFVEITKGFEYQPIRKRIVIEPGQRELLLSIHKEIQWRERGWVTADTHVHFLSPQTAWLEAKAEGVNLVNLLASQWGDLFTNVTDITGNVSGVSEDDTIVWVGTENRQHILGHISLLGVKGDPIFPMCTGGPDESFFGDPTMTSLAEWSDLCRERDGIVVLPHFPQPYCEAGADIVLGKIDAVEIRNFIPGIESSSMREWYRYLNCGYRLAAVGGSDKMSAGIPVGGVRTYALINDEEFSFASWAQAVKAGRTFTTSGPLIDISVEGRHPGDQMKLPRKGGKLSFEAHVESIYPVHELQIIMNGKVIESKISEPGTRTLQISGEAKVQQSCWIAARCVSKLKAQHTWPVNHVAAHTSPIYFHCGDEEIFNPSDATYILTLIEGGLTWLDTLSVPANPERHDALRNIFNKAHASLAHRFPSRRHRG